MSQIAIKAAFHKASNAYWESSVLSETSPDRLKAACIAYAAALSQSSQAVGVKELEWRAYPDIRYREGFRPNWFLAENYKVYFDGKWRVDDKNFGFFRQVFDTLEAAKEAAQADFEQRIRSALTPTQQAEPEAYVVEGPGWKRVFLSKEAAEILAKPENSAVTPLYALASPQAVPGLEKAIDELERVLDQADHCLTGYGIGKVDIRGSMVELANQVAIGRKAIAALNAEVSKS